MKFPAVICLYDWLAVVDERYFDLVGDLNVPANSLVLNAGSQGPACLKWILDSDAVFFPLKFVEQLPQTLLQLLKLKRRRERYEIGPGQAITVNQLAERIASLNEKYEEAPILGDLKDLLVSLPGDQALDAEQMRQYFGTDEP